MKTALRLLFGSILAGMTAVTVWASLHENVAVGLVKVLKEPWAAATLADAYAGFLTFAVWVFYKEPRARVRGLWIVAILLLGNIAMAAYVLVQLWRLPAGAPLEKILLRREPCTGS